MTTITAEPCTTHPVSLPSPALAPSSTGRAYDLCQCDDAYASDGQMMHIAREGVVGLTNTWPVAVTVAHGQLHSVADDQNPLQVFPEFTAAQCIAAVQFAKSLGYAIAPAFQRFDVPLAIELHVDASTQFATAYMGEWPVATLARRPVYAPAGQPLWKIYDTKARLVREVWLSCTARQLARRIEVSLRLG